MKYDPQIHHRRSIRLQGFDYSQPGSYFITIVTYDRKCFLSKIIDGEIILTNFGKIAKLEWDRLIHRFHSILLDSHIIMPNHIHGIITIEPQPDDTDSIKMRKEQFEQFGRPVKGSIPTIIRSFKASTTLRCRNKIGFSDKQFWQSGFYEHVIRDDDDLNRIREYIDLNPDNWLLDEEYC